MEHKCIERESTGHQRMGGGVDENFNINSDIVVLDTAKGRTPAYGARGMVESLTINSRMFVLDKNGGARGYGVLVDFRDLCSECKGQSTRAWAEGKKLRA